MKQLANANVENSSGTPDARFQVLARWSFLMMQLFECRTFLDLAETTHYVHSKSTLVEILTQQALFRSFLLAYGKCFASSGKGRSSLDAKKVFSEQQDLLSVHTRIMDLRHKFAAHNDESGLDQAIVDVEERQDKFVIAHRYAVANPLHEYEPFRKAVGVVEEYVVAQTNRAIDSLEKKLQKPITVIGNEA